jgi:hypothetical protein
MVRIRWNSIKSRLEDGEAEDVPDQVPQLPSRFKLLPETTIQDQQSPASTPQAKRQQNSEQNFKLFPSNFHHVPFLPPFSSTHRLFFN